MLRLEIVTPEKRVLDAEVDSVTVPTASGEVGILPSHAPLVSAIKPGILSFTVKGATDKLAISGGFLEVNANKVAVLADSAETAEEIDIDAARTTRDEAEKAFAAAASLSLVETEAVREQLDAANVRLQLAGGR
ncbi:MAG TPA: F0F1 ATP synthase subunit epsilon [Pyrinomonadaceae bacterium]|nr:F0F1 ATP synthase subunit epsilon [Acidobacteriota bacterium]HQZ97166.1 F0F1 ATP synthase subunit epsilon [Pyrinomonadaceae bacterium]